MTGQPKPSVTCVTVRLFAVARQLTGQNSVVVKLPAERTVGALRMALVEKHPELARIVASSIFAVGGDYVDEQRQLNSDDEIACIPPVSGG